MRLVLRGATVIDGSGTDPIRNASVVINQGLIEDVTSQNVQTRGAELVDCDGLTLLPGLIDAHTHLGAAIWFTAQNQAGSVSLAELAAAIFRNCELALKAGFTTCRELGGLDAGVCRAIDQGLVVGPRILPSGPGITQHGGHGAFMPPYSDCYCPIATAGLSQFTVVCSGVEEVRLAARRNFLRGATQLKLFTSGGVVSDTLEHTQLMPDEIRIAVMEAEARNTYVTVHAHNLRGIKQAIAAGVKCIEHGSYVDEPTAKVMAEGDIGLVPTLTVNRLMMQEWRNWGLPPQVEPLLPKLGEVIRGMERAVSIGRNAGVSVGLGSDLLGPEQNRRGFEIVLRARLEDPMAAIVAATSVNARILRLGDKIGTLRAGSVADVIAVSGDPLNDVELFDDPSRIALVVKEGRIVKRT